MLPGEGPNCPRCAWWDPGLDGCLAPFEMDRIARRAIHRYKYGPCPELAGILAPFIQPSLVPATFDAAVAVPLHRRRERERGFNQAQRLLDHLELPPIPGSLERYRYTSHQVGRGEDARRRGVGGAFRYRGPTLEGLRIALVDDVVTTGATARECAITLKDFGARSVTVIALARASYLPRPASDPILEDEVPD
jgi:ComF family protein